MAEHDDLGVDGPGGLCDVAGPDGRQLKAAHAGPISQPKDAAYIIANVPGIDGFFGATSIERLAAEKGIKEQTEAFKAIKK
ncbi:MAG: phosphoenolpyruvate hydrolase family protein [Coriobacteriales bacterium]|nr:phosphoenolpyruvate hydrolase family protein [Coriobacteriales bacterium]